MPQQLRIIYAGTPDFATPALRALADSEHRVVAVYTQPDRPAGRGRKLTPSPVKQVALERGIEVVQPQNFKQEADLARLEAFGADLMVVAAYGLILPQRVLDAPRLGCINLHASLLPRWRGAAPIQRAILAGDTESGITIMGMELGLDTGPMHLKLATPIGPEDTGGALHDRLMAMGAEALMQALPALIDGRVEPEPQDDALATYAKKLDKAEAALDWGRSALELDRQVRAFNPWPVAQTRFRGEPLRIWEAQPIGAVAHDHPGQVLRAERDGIEVACKQGALRIRTLQQPGKRAMSAADFLNAHDLEGVQLG